MAKGLKSKLARMILHYIRMWDQRTAAAVDQFVANSHFIARRIEKAYRRPSTVIYPPVDTKGFNLQLEKQDYYLTASRMVPYKKIPMIVQAFTAMPDKKLIVIGEGPEFDKAKAAAGPNVTLLGYQSFEVLRTHMQNARGFVFAAEEDFGISPVEAQACGTPVIAYGRGGTLETVRGLDDSAPTGVFYQQQSVEALIAAVQQFEAECHRITPQACRENAEQFSEKNFERQMRMFVEARCADANLVEPVAVTPRLVLAADNKTLSVSVTSL
jgi:glycosyltransferase involved in cell wall biosynthesis